MTCRSRTQPIATALSALAVACVFTAAPQSAFAQGCTGAPGASAIQQYCEAVPSADGGSESAGGSTDRESRDGSGGSGNSGSSGSNDGVTAKTSRALEEAGADGASVERLAGGTRELSDAKSSTKQDEKATSDPSSESDASTDDGAVLSERIDGPSDPDGSPLKAATNAVANGPTAGTGLAWSLAGLSIIGVAGAVFFRRRGGSDAGLDDES